MEIIGWACYIIWIVCWIMVLIPMFKESALHGILGIVTCSLWAFIRGWMKAKDYKVEKVMMIWTATAVVWFIAVGIGLFTLFSGEGA